MLPFPTSPSFYSALSQTTLLKSHLQLLIRRKAKMLFYSSHSSLPKSTTSNSCTHKCDLLLNLQILRLKRLQKCEIYMWLFNSGKEYFEKALQYLDIFGHNSRNCKNNRKPCNTNETLLEALEKIFPIFKFKKKFK